MNKVDKNRPVSSIKHEDKRAAIPDSAHQGEEQMAISGMPEQSEYDIFRHSCMASGGKWFYPVVGGGAHSACS